VYVSGTAVKSTAAKHIHIVSNPDAVFPGCLEVINRLRKYGLQAHGLACGTARALPPTRNADT
jgi:hypothetical protein